MEAEEPLSAKRWVKASVEQILRFLPDGIDLVVVEGKKNKNKISRQLNGGRGVRKLSRVVSQQRRLGAFYLRTKKTYF